MKKIIALSVSLLLLAHPAFAEGLGGKFFLGLILTVAGTAAVVDGYSQVKEDISRPLAAVSNFAWSDNPGQLRADSIGTLTNTGNVDLSRVNIAVTYYDAGHTALGTDTFFYDNLSVNQSGNWSHEYRLQTGQDAADAAASVTGYSYAPLYKRTTKNETEGMAGVAVAAAGLYLVVSSMIDLNKMDDYLTRHHLNIKLARRNNTIGFAVIKHI